MTPDGVRMYRHRHGIPAAKVQGQGAPSTEASSPLSAFAVGIETDAGSAEYVVISSDIVSAASIALRLIKGRDPDADLTSIRYLAETLRSHR